MKLLIRAVLLVLALSVLTAGVWAEYANVPDSDLEQLLTLSNTIIISEKKVIIKSTTAFKNYTSKHDFIQKGRVISDRLAINKNVQVVTTQDQLLYKAVSVDEHGIETMFLLIGFLDGKAELRIQVKAEHELAINHILLSHKELAMRLEAFIEKPQWNVMIQGVPAPAYNEFNTAYLSLAQNLQAHELGRYQDIGSLSISCYSPVLGDPSLAISRKEKMNLQLAVHRDSITQRQRITLGTPAISIEY
jgi:hypothetical protein